jgi:hypothetical protein
VPVFNFLTELCVNTAAARCAVGGGGALGMRALGRGRSAVLRDFCHGAVTASVIKKCRYFLLRSNIYKYLLLFFLFFMTNKKKRRKVK